MRFIQFLKNPRYTSTGKKKTPITNITEKAEEISQVENILLQPEKIPQVEEEHFFNGKIEL